MSERVMKTSYRGAFFTVKDHKENFRFQDNPQVRLLNPCKPELGRISKLVLQKIIVQIRKKSNLIQWQNTDSLISWFRNLSNKKRKKFIQFDIVSMYPSITLELLERALIWAQSLVNISDPGYVNYQKS